MIENLDHLSSKSAHRELRPALHEHHHVIPLHFIVDKLLDAHGIRSCWAAQPPLSAIYVSQKIPPTQEPFAGSPGFWCIEGAFNLEKVVLVERSDLDNGAWRIRAPGPKLLLKLVYQGPQPTHIGDENSQADAIRKAGALGLRNAFHVQKRLTDAGLFALHQAIIRRIDAAHAGDEHKISGTHPQAPRACRFDRPVR